jgi:hypothetical protein
MELLLMKINKRAAMKNIDVEGITREIVCARFFFLF